MKKHKVVHRDIKLDNFMMRHSGQVCSCKIGLFPGGGGGWGFSSKWDVRHHTYRHGGGWVLLPCDQIGADAIWIKNGQKMDKK